MRHPGILLLLLERKVEGKNWVNKHRVPYIEQIVHVSYKSHTEMKELAFIREE